VKIVSTYALTPAQRKMLEQGSGGADISDRTCRSAAETAALMRGGCDVLLAFRLPEDPLGCAPELKWIQLLSAGADRMLAGPLRNASIPVTTSSGIHATPIAEYIIGSILAYSHRFHVAIRAQLRRQWMRQAEFMATVDEVRGKTIGIVGYGSIGRETARIAQALGVRVLALKRHPESRSDPGWCPPGLGDPEGRIPERFFGPDRREAMLAESDYVAVTLPLTDETHRFIGARELAAMKPEAYVVNVGRGGLIDQGALIEALRDRRIGGAGLDVFEREPLETQSPLWELENVILTPHISGANRGYMDKACELFSENLRRFRAGLPLLNKIDPELGY
jgi:phosphoglycerate dehydrogenase-like enzyme